MGQVHIWSSGQGHIEDSHCEGYELIVDNRSKLFAKLVVILRLDGS